MSNQLNRAAKALSQMRVDRKREKEMPAPTRADLERKFRMDFKPDGKPVIREVK